MRRELWLRIGTGFLGVVLAAAGGAYALFGWSVGLITVKEPQEQIAKTPYFLDCKLDENAAKNGSGVWLVYHDQSLPDAVFDRIVTDSAGVWDCQSTDAQGARFYQKNTAGLDTWRIEFSNGKRECTVTLIDDTRGGVYEIRRYRTAGEDTAETDAAIAAFSLAEQGF